MSGSESLRATLAAALRSEKVAAEKLQKISPLALLAVVHEDLVSAQRSSAPLQPTALLAANLAQKGLRRAPVSDSCEPALRNYLVPAMLTAASVGDSTILTQLGLGAAVCLIRTEAWPADQLLNGLGERLHNVGTCASERAAMLMILTVLAEELHSPAAKISVPPLRTAAVRSALRRDAQLVLATLQEWHVQQVPGAVASMLCGPAATLRCGHAWCVAHLIDARVATSSALLTSSALSCLAGSGSPIQYSHESRLAAHATDVLCATIECALLPLEVPPAAARGRSAFHMPDDDASEACDGSLPGLLPALCAQLLEPVASLPPSRHRSAIICEASSLLGLHLLRCLTERALTSDCTSAAPAAATTPPGAVVPPAVAPGAAREAAHAVASALAGWLPLLLACTAAESEEESAAARGCWIELHDLILQGEDDGSGGSGGGGGGGSTGAGIKGPPSEAALALESALAPFRSPLLESVLSCGGQLPSNLGVLPAAERDAVDDTREECRALLRGAVFVGDGVVEAALEALRQRAEKVLAHADTAREAFLQAATVEAQANAGRALSESARIVEAVLHATSAAAKPLGPHRLCVPLSILFSSVLPAASRLAEFLISKGEGLGRALLATQLVLVGAFASWLAHPERASEVQSVLPLVLASLRVPEEEALGVWSLRSKQEHSGVVALMKLSALAPKAVLQAVPLPTLLEGLIAASAAPPSVLHGLSSQSASLLLVAASDLVSHALAGGATSAAEQLALTHGLLGQVVVVLEQSARNGSYDEATRHTLRLATLLRRLPRELQPTAVGIVGYIVGYSPSPILLQMLSTTGADGAQDGAMLAASECLGSIFIGCGAHAAPMIPMVADAAWNFFQHQPVSAIQLILQLVTCAVQVAVASSSEGGGGPPEQSPSGQSAEHVAAALLSRVAQSLASLPVPADADEDALQQAALSEWFDSLAALCSGGHAPGTEARGHSAADGHVGVCQASSGDEQLSADRAISALVKPALPAILQAIWRTTQPRGPPKLDRGMASVVEMTEGMRALKSALLLWQRCIIPPSPVAPSLQAALQGQLPSQAGLMVVAPNGDAPGAAPGAALIRALLIGMSSWMPSWILSDVVACFWILRHALEKEFTAWLGGALAPSGVPRPGLTADHKASFMRELLDAKSKSHFKATLKQLCGGKKKQTSGTPPAH